MSYERIRVQRSDGVERITLAHASRRNAVSPQMTSELLAALRAAQEDDSVRALVLTGDG